MRARASKERAKALLCFKKRPLKPPRNVPVAYLFLNLRVLSGLRVDQVGTWFVNMRKRVLRPGQGLPAGTRLPVKDASFPKQVHRENFAEASSVARGGDAEKILRTGLRTASSPRDVAALWQGIQVSPSQSLEPVDFSYVRPSTASLWRSSSPTYPGHDLLQPSSLGMQMPRERVEQPKLMMLVPPGRSHSTSSFTSFDDAPFDDPWGSSTNSDHHESDAWHVEPEPLSTCHLTLPSIYVVV